MITNPMLHSSIQEANNCSAGQEIPVFYGILGSLPYSQRPSSAIKRTQSTPLTYTLCTIHNKHGPYNISRTSGQTSHELFLSAFAALHFQRSLQLPMHATCLHHLNITDLIFLKMLRMKLLNCVFFSSLSLHHLAQVKVFCSTVRSYNFKQSVPQREQHVSMTTMNQLMLLQCSSRRSQAKSLNL